MVFFSFLFNLFYVVTKCFTCKTNFCAENLYENCMIFLVFIMCCSFKHLYLRFFFLFFFYIYLLVRSVVQSSLTIIADGISCCYTWMLSGMFFFFIQFVSLILLFLAFFTNCFLVVIYFTNTNNKIVSPHMPPRHILLLPSHKNTNLQWNVIFFFLFQFTITMKS